jgi:hypothetical protein
VKQKYYLRGLGAVLAEHRYAQEALLAVLQFLGDKFILVFIKQIVLVDPVEFREFSVFVTTLVEIVDHLTVNCRL